MTITEFLEARIAEDAAALERTSWYPHSTHGQDAIGTYRADCPDCLGVPSRARVLAECKAKRRILDLYEFHRENRDARRSPLARAAEDERATQERRTQEARARVAEDALRALASVYADHPDYQQEWALEA